MPGGRCLPPGAGSNKRLRKFFNGWLIGVTKSDNGCLFVLENIMDVKMTDFPAANNPSADFLRGHSASLQKSTCEIHSPILCQPEALIPLNDRHLNGCGMFRQNAHQKGEDAQHKQDHAGIRHIEPGVLDDADDHAYQPQQE